MITIQKFRHSIIVRTISIVLLMSFLAYDIVWAYPDHAATKKSPNNKLAPTSFFKDKESIDRLYGKMIEGHVENNGIPRYRLTLEAVKAALKKIENEKWFKDSYGYTESKGEICISFLGYMLRYFDPGIADEEKYANQRKSAGGLVKTIILNDGRLCKQLLKTKALPAPVATGLKEQSYEARKTVYNGRFRFTKPEYKQNHFNLGSFYANKELRLGPLNNDWSKGFEVFCDNKRMGRYYADKNKFYRTIVMVEENGLVNLNLKSDGDGKKFYLSPTFIGKEIEIRSKDRSKNFVLLYDGSVIARYNVVNDKFTPLATLRSVNDNGVFFYNGKKFDLGPSYANHSIALRPSLKEDDLSGNLRVLYKGVTAALYGSGVFSVATNTDVEGKFIFEREGYDRSEFDLEPAYAIMPILVTPYDGQSFSTGFMVTSRDGEFLATYQPEKHEFLVKGKGRLPGSGPGTPEILQGPDEDIPAEDGGEVLKETRKTDPTGRLNFTRAGYKETRFNIGVPYANVKVTLIPYKDDDWSTGFEVIYNGALIATYDARANIFSRALLTRKVNSLGRFQFTREGYGTIGFYVGMEYCGKNVDLVPYKNDDWASGFRVIYEGSIIAVYNAAKDVFARTYEVRRTDYKGRVNFARGGYEIKRFNFGTAYANRDIVFTPYAEDNFKTGFFGTLRDEEEIMALYDTRELMIRGDKSIRACGAAHLLEMEGSDDNSAIRELKKNEDEALERWKTRIQKAKAETDPIARLRKIGAVIYTYCKAFEDIELERQKLLKQVYEDIFSNIPRLKGIFKMSPGLPLNLISSIPQAALNKIELTEPSPIIKFARRSHVLNTFYHNMGANHPNDILLLGTNKMFPGYTALIAVTKNRAGVSNSITGDVIKKLNGFIAHEWTFEGADKMVTILYLLQDSDKDGNSLGTPILDARLNRLNENVKSTLNNNYIFSPRAMARRIVDFEDIIEAAPRGDIQLKADDLKYALLRTDKALKRIKERKIKTGEETPLLAKGSNGFLKVVIGNIHKHETPELDTLVYGLRLDEEAKVEAEAFTRSMRSHIGLVAKDLSAGEKDSLSVMLREINNDVRLRKRRAVAKIDELLRDEKAPKIVVQTLRAVKDEMVSSYYFIKTDKELEEHIKFLKEIFENKLNLMKQASENLPDHIKEMVDTMKNVLFGDLPLIEEEIRNKKVRADRYIIDNILPKIERMKNVPNDKINAIAREAYPFFMNILNELKSAKAVSAGKPRHISDKPVIIAAKRFDIVSFLMLRASYPNIAAIITDEGTPQSHWVMIATFFDIPVMTGLYNKAKDIKSGCDIIRDEEEVVLDFDDETATLNPTDQTLEEAEVKQRRLQRLDAFTKMRVSMPAVTKDNKVSIELYQNVDLVICLDQYIEANLKKLYGEGIGLVRTEFEFTNNFKNLINIYTVASRMMPDKPVVIRTIDYEPDKADNENLPSSSHRGIDYYKHDEGRAALMTQLKALLLAYYGYDMDNGRIDPGKKCGNLRIMFPMIRNMDDLKYVLSLLEEAKRAVYLEFGIQFKDLDVSTGAMAETRGAIEGIEPILKTEDFTSLGTNDLIKLTYAVDRDNPDHLPYYTEFKNEIAMDMDKVCRVADKLNKDLPEGARRKKVGVCGDLARNRKYFLYFLYLKAKYPDAEITPSMPNEYIPLLKEMTRWVTIEDLKIFDGLTWESDEKKINYELDRLIENIFERITGSAEFKEHKEEELKGHGMINEPLQKPDIEPAALQQNIRFLVDEPNKAAAQFILTNPHALHSRPVSRLYTYCSSLKNNKIFIILPEGGRISGMDNLSLLAAAVKCGDELRVEIEGPNAKKIAGNVIFLLNNDIEDATDKMPHKDIGKSEEPPSQDGFIMQGTEAFKIMLENLKKDAFNDITGKLVPDTRIAEELTGLRMIMTDAVVMAKDDFSFGFYSHAPPVRKEIIAIIGEKEFTRLFPTPTLLLSKEILSNPEIISEYLYHEIMCNSLGHYEAIFAQQKKFPENYIKKNAYNIDEAGKKYLKGHKGDLTKPFKGKLGEILREIIDLKALNIGLKSPEKEKVAIVATLFRIMLSGKIRGLINKENSVTATGILLKFIELKEVTYDKDKKIIDDAVKKCIDEAYPDLAVDILIKLIELKEVPYNEVEAKIKGIINTCSNNKDTDADILVKLLGLKEHIDGNVKSTILDKIKAYINTGWPPSVARILIKLIELKEVRYRGGLSMDPDNIFIIRDAIDRCISQGHHDSAAYILIKLMELKEISYDMDSRMIDDIVKKCIDEKHPDEAAKILLKLVEFKELTYDKVKKDIDDAIKKCIDTGWSDSAADILIKLIELKAITYNKDKTRIDDIVRICVNRRRPVSAADILIKLVELKEAAYSDVKAMIDDARRMCIGEGDSASAAKILIKLIELKELTYEKDKNAIDEKIKIYIDKGEVSSAAKILIKLIEMKEITYDKDKIIIDNMIKVCLDKGWPNLAADILIKLIKLKEISYDKDKTRIDDVMDRCIDKERPDLAADMLQGIRGHILAESSAGMGKALRGDIDKDMRTVTSTIARLTNLDEEDVAELLLFLTVSEGISIDEIKKDVLTGDAASLFKLAISRAERDNAGNLIRIFKNIISKDTKIFTKETLRHIISLKGRVDAEALCKKVILNLYFKQPDLFDNDILKLLESAFAKDAPEMKYLLFFASRHETGPPAYDQSLFPHHTFVRDNILKGKHKILVMHNIQDGIGDEIIRNVPLIQALLDSNPELEVVMYTGKPYLYSHPRVETRGVTAYPIIDTESYDMIIHHYDPSQRYSDEINNIFLKYLDTHPPKVYIKTNKSNDEFIYEKVRIGTNDVILPTFSGNVYLAPYELCAELGLKAMRMGTEQPAASIFTALLAPYAEKYWQENVVNANRENRPVLIFNGFGGESEGKGYRRTETGRSEFAKALKDAVSAGYFVIVLPNHRDWGTPLQAHTITYRLSENEKQQVLVAPSPIKDPSMHKYLVAKSDIVFTVEGGMMHLAYNMGKPLQIISMTYSGSLEKWFSIAADSKQKISGEDVGKGLRSRIADLTDSAKIDELANLGIPPIETLSKPEQENALLMLLIEQLSRGMSSNVSGEISLQKLRERLKRPELTWQEAVEHVAKVNLQRDALQSHTVLMPDSKTQTFYIVLVEAKRGAAKAKSDKEEPEQKKAIENKKIVKEEKKRIRVPERVLFRDYFEDLFETNLELFIILAKRKSDDVRKNEEAARARDLLVEKLRAIPVAYSPSKFSKYKDIVDSVNTSIIKTINLINNNDEPAAQWCIFAAIEKIAGARGELFNEWLAEKRETSAKGLVREGRRMRLRRGLYRIAKGGKRPIKEPGLSSYSTLWEMRRSVFDEIYSEISDRGNMRIFIESIDAIVKRMEKAGYKIDDAGCREIAAQIVNIAGSMVKPGAELKVEEKRIALLLLKACAVIISEGDRYAKSVEAFLMQARGLLLKRFDDTGSIAKQLHKVDLNIIWAEMKKRDSNIYDRINGKDAIIESLNKKLYYRAYWLTVNTSRLNILKEPEYENIYMRLWAASESIDKSRRTGYMSQDARTYLNAATKICDEAALLRQMLERYADELVKKALVSAEAIDKDAILKNVFTEFAKKSNLLMGAPQAQERAKLWARLYQAVNIPMKIDNPENRSERISNSVFEAVSDYILILDFKYIQNVLNTKPFSGTKLPAAKALLEDIISTRRHLIREDLPKIIEAIIKDYNFDGEMAALLRACVMREDREEKIELKGDKNLVYLLRDVYDLKDEEAIENMAEKALEKGNPAQTMPGKLGEELARLAIKPDSDSITPSGLAIDQACRSLAMKIDGAVLEAYIKTIEDYERSEFIPRIARHTDPNYEIDSMLANLDIAFFQLGKENAKLIDETELKARALGMIARLRSYYPDDKVMTKEFISDMPAMYSEIKEMRDKFIAEIKKKNIDIDNVMNGYSSIKSLKESDGSEYLIRYALLTMKEILLVLEDLEAFLKDEPGRIEDIDLSLLVSDIFPAYGSEIAPNIMIEGNNRRIASLVYSINKNAKEAGATEIVPSLSREGDWAVIRVKDNGFGISSNNFEEGRYPARSRLYDLGWSTKEKKSGRVRGTGTYEMWKVVGDADGTIEVESISKEDGHANTGTTITIKLPLRSKGIEKKADRLEIEKLLKSLHDMHAGTLSSGISALAKGAEVVLSENLFTPEDRIALESVVGKGDVKILNPEAIRSMMINSSTSKEKLVCVLTRSEFNNVLMPSHKTNNRATVLVLDESLKDERYLYTEGVIGLARAMMYDDRTRIKAYMSLLFSTTIDDQLLNLLRDDNPIEFAIKAMLKFKPIIPVKPEDLEHYKKMMEKYLVSA